MRWVSDAGLDRPVKDCLCRLKPDLCATMPVELGFQTSSMTSGEGEHQYTSKCSCICLEVGFGALLGKKD